MQDFRLKVQARELKLDILLLHCAPYMIVRR
jgi:hypothetical protein